MKDNQLKYQAGHKELENSISSIFSIGSHTTISKGTERANLDFLWNKFADDLSPLLILNLVCSHPDNLDLTLKKFPKSIIYILDFIVDDKTTTSYLNKKYPNQIQFINEQTMLEYSLDNKFDIVLGCMILHEIENEKGINYLNFVMSCLKPRGKFIFFELINDKENLQHRLIKSYQRLFSSNKHEDANENTENYFDIIPLFEKLNYKYWQYKGVGNTQSIYLFNPIE